MLTITGSTLSGNTAKLGGGGLFNNGTATLTDSTIADNFANQAGSLLASNGGGVDNSGTATLRRLHGHRQHDDGRRRRPLQRRSRRPTSMSLERHDRRRQLHDVDGIQRHGDIGIDTTSAPPTT